jgi:hypothetical protein
MAKTTITQSERLQLIGLLAVGDNLSKQLAQVERTMQDITGETGAIGSGHCSDALYGVDSTNDKAGDVDHLLYRLSIKVTD